MQKRGYMVKIKNESTRKRRCEEFVLALMKTDCYVTPD